MTADASKATVDEVMKEVGGRQIRYGHIVAGDARGVMGVAEPENVATDPNVRSARNEINEKLGGILPKRTM